MGKYTTEFFERKKQKIIDEFLSGFIPKYNNHAIKSEFASDNLVDVENKIREHYNSSQKLNAEFHLKIIPLKDEQIGRTYAEAIVLYCQEINQTPKELFEYILKIVALDELKNMLIQKYGGRANRYLAIPDFEEHPKNRNNRQGKNNSSQPIARKIIILSLLLEAAKQKDDLLSNKDKTDIARFIDVLISETPFNGNIRDNHVYKKTKELYNNISESTIEDLKFAALEFEKIGLSSIVSTLKAAIETKSKKKNK